MLVPGERQPPLAIQYLGAVVVAAALILVIDALTNSSPPKWDGVAYVDMATNGLVDNPRLKAPFAYRPGMPLVSRAISDLLDVPIEQGFRIVVRVCAFSFLLSLFVLARHIAADYRSGLLTMSVLGLTGTQVKLPLFFYSLVDVSAYPLMVLAFWALVTRRRALCLIVSSVGIFFKEFLAVPLILLWYELGREYRHGRSRSQLAWLAVAVVVGLAVILVPRLVIPVSGTDQFVDPINNPKTLIRLFAALGNFPRNVNIIYSIASYWLPTLLLLTWARVEALRSDLRDLHMLLKLHVALVFVLTLYGGTNVLIFVGYTVAVQTVVLAFMFRRGVAGLEVAYVMGAMFVYHKLALHFPLPDDDFESFVDFYGGWTTRVNMATAVRLLEIALFWIGAQVVRALGERYRHRQAAR